MMAEEAAGVIGKMANTTLSTLKRLQKKSASML
jgi:hypothetical protein